MYVVFDIGGSKIRMAASRDCKTFVDEPKVFNTPENFDEGIELFERTLPDLCHGESVMKAAGGIAGPLNREKTKVINAPHVASWNHKPLQEKLSKVFSAPVFLENDTSLVGLGEAVFGGGRGNSIVMYMTVSTGVGGVRIVGGRIDKNRFGFEPGHQIVDPARTLCPHAETGELEAIVSGTAVAKRFGKAPYEIGEKEVWEKELPRLLAYGLTNSILHWSPDIVVLGGSMITGNPAISVPHTEAYVREYLTIFPELPRFVKGELGDFGGLYGGLAYLG